MTKKEPTAESSEKKQMRIRYSNMDTAYASQFMVNSNREEVIINFSPGYLSDPQTSETVMPIQTRVAMTPQGAARLANALANVLKQMQDDLSKSTEEQ